MHNGLVKENRQKRDRDGLANPKTFLKTVVVSYDDFTTQIVI